LSICRTVAPAATRVFSKAPSRRCSTQLSLSEPPLRHRELTQKNHSGHMQDSSNTETNSRRIALTGHLPGKRFSLTRRGRDRGRSVPGFSIYGSRNYTLLIREMSIDGHHPSGVMRSPLHGATVAQSQGQDPRLKGDNALFFKETFTDLWDRRQGFFFPEWRGGGKERLNVYGSAEPRRRLAS
jgi:hypothetical protein